MDSDASQNSLGEDLDQIGRLNISIPNINLTQYLNRPSFNLPNLPTLDLKNLSRVKTFSDDISNYISHYISSYSLSDNATTITSMKTAISTRIQMNNFLNDLNLGFSLAAAIDRLEPLTSIIHEAIILPTDDSMENDVGNFAEHHLAPTTSADMSAIPADVTEPVGVEKIVHKHNQPLVNEIVNPEKAAASKSSTSHRSSRHKKKRKLSNKKPKSIAIFSTTDGENNSTQPGSDLDQVDELTSEEVRALTDLQSTEDFQKEDLLRHKIQNIQSLTNLSQKSKNKLVTRLMMGSYYKYINKEIPDKVKRLRLDTDVQRSGRQDIRTALNHELDHQHELHHEHHHDHHHRHHHEHHRRATETSSSLSLAYSENTRDEMDISMASLTMDEAAAISDASMGASNDNEGLVDGDEEEDEVNDEDELLPVEGGAEEEEEEEEEEEDLTRNDAESQKIDEGEVILTELDLIPTYYNKASNIMGCQHYQRNCKLECPTCLKWYTCRFCHDQEVTSHKLIRSAVKHILCMSCSTPQNPSDNYCIECGIELANYFCLKCVLYDNDPTKDIYHCDKCGICRLGLGIGKDYFHCDKCNICLSIDLKERHKCISNTTHCNCPICNEYLFTSINKVVFMKCGHSIHQHCYDELTKHSFKCPLCKKTVVDVETQFRILDQEIYQSPLPAPYNLWRCIVSCNDCKGKSNVSYHVLGLKCEYCKSYNTNQLKLIKPEEEEEEEAEEANAQNGGSLRETENSMRLIGTNLQSNFRIDEQNTSATHDEGYDDYEYDDYDNDENENDDEGDDDAGDDDDDDDENDIDDSGDDERDQNLISFRSLRRLRDRHMGGNFNVHKRENGKMKLSVKGKQRDGAGGEPGKEGDISNVSYIASVLQGFINSVSEDAGEKGRKRGDAVH